ncbi:MAG TPA: hypothetical protein VHE34_08420 [Puia sp.]|uniref:hypothetical protein n=1 Tax=Puia sp. TaxID=2045100 RepID=UPI002BCBAD64|nr:hypothetical protein [Puia sp.]HVU95233.1 hypothetical protein [Puia sp.]
MLGLFKKDSAPQSPLKDHRRQWVESSFQWLTTVFDRQAILHRKVLVPHYSHFPIRYNGDPQTATDTLDIVAAQMEISTTDLELNIYDDSYNQLSTGSPTGARLAVVTEGEPPADEPWPTVDETGKYPITLKKSRLQNPELLVATLARDLAKIKLSGEARITRPDAPLTDLTTLIFGLGVFNANAAFMSQNLRTTGENARMTQMEWGYGLALFAHLRNEKKPAWTEHLVKNIRSDFQKSEQYLAYHHNSPQKSERRSPFAGDPPMAESENRP